MKIRTMVLCFAATVAIAASNVFAQDCAPCAAAANATCASCATCSDCAGCSCELFGGLRSLLACRPCRVAECAPCPLTCAPVCGGPIVKTNLPSCDVPATCDVCDTCAPICAPAPCCGPMFPYLKPCLYNAVHRPINGVCKIVHGAFSALACATTPKSDCGFFKPAYCDVPCPECGVCGGCDACSTCGPTACGPIEAAPAPCGPAIPACK